MPLILWITIFGLMMSAVAFVGIVTLALPDAVFKRIILPLVSLAAGTLIGGASFHLLPQAVEILGNTHAVYASLICGFVTMFILEQFLQWHHCHKSLLKHKPVGYLMLLADGIHNFIGGISVGAAFVINIKLGIITWLVAVAHEIPQELGDFGILINSGWRRNLALLYNFISALTFPLGALVAYAISPSFDMSFILAFAAGNFIYIGAADLIPQLHETTNTKNQIVQLTMFLLGLSIMHGLAVLE